MKQKTLEGVDNIIKNKEEHIKESWFKNHKVELTQHGDLQVLDWRNPESGFYYCRYVFDGNKVYISGDIGEAIFWLTWKAEVHSFDDIHIDYFEEKLQAYSGNKRDFCSDKAVIRLKEWQTELDEDGYEYDKDMMMDLINDTKTKGYSSKEQWAYECINDYRWNNFISELDANYWEWIYNIGDEIPMRIYGYLIGLQMASKQLISKL